jgi:NADPH-dependent 7-cyano-7-deazaguanine reductase QueF
VYSRYISERLMATNELLKSYLDTFLNKNIVIEKEVLFIFFYFVGDLRGI